MRLLSRIENARKEVYKKTKKIHPRMRYLGSLVAKINPLDIVAVLFFAFLFVKAIYRIDMRWDSLAYHLPVAGRIGRIFTPDEFQFWISTERRALGFPLFGEALQGLLWRILGFPAAANLANWAVALLIAIVARIKLKLPFWKITLFVFSIPMVLIHSTSSYIDLIANGILVIGFILLLESYENSNVSLKQYVLILICVGLAINTKFTIVPPALVLFVLSFVYYLFKRLKQAGSYRWLFQKTAPLVLVTLIALPLMSFTYLKNQIRWGNFLYPLNISVGPVSFVGDESRDDYMRGGKRSLPKGFEEKSSLELYVLSVSEFYLYKDNDGVLFSIDNNVGLNSKSFKLGGWFVGNLALWWCFVLSIALFRRDRKTILLGGLLIALFVMNGFLPLGRFLRYWLYLPILLSLLVLVLQRDFVKHEKTLVMFTTLVQVFLAIFVLRHTYNSLVTFEKYDLGKYEINEDVNSVCIVGGSRVGMLYKLANPDKNIEHVVEEDRCDFSYVKVDEEK